MRFVRPFSTIAVSLLIVTGCSHMQQLTRGTDDVCGSLQQLIDDYDNGFAGFRGKGTQMPLSTVYDAKVELVEGHCQIWNWGQGDSAYLCSASNRDLETARQRHERSLAAVRGCLGSPWQEEGDWRERNGETDGYASRFRSPETHAVVSVQTTLQTGGPGRRYTNFLFIGGEARSNSMTGTN
ncbi:hypothetical protein [Marinobacter mobilis]|uniref:Lipoprotein n=1 Tax=Marinobacter mobilis TaxID=488533 RepID=A0A1H2WDL7_9GAMM|nr:hypothetical protein [Marinobacter mobilis]SDW78566.1 hypothetical protein SAMN04487960_104127 [Marinobacter mobilis]